jgi:glucokinase
MGKGDELLTFALEHDTMANTPINNEVASVNAYIVAEAAQAGIPVARKIIHRAAEALGVGLVDIIHIFNPEIIILGGGVSHMGDLLLEPALHIVATRTMRVPRETVRIVPAKLGNDVGLIGAGALIYYNT